MKTANILVVTYWSFENALIQTYTLPYVFQIKKQLSEKSKIYLFTLSTNSYSTEQHQKIKVLEAENIFVLRFSYAKFGWLMAVKMAFMVIYLIAFTLFKRIHTVHAWCTPGGAIGYLVSLFTGRKLVLDSFEPHAETMVESGVWKKNSFAFKLLFCLEKLQLGRATEVICAAEGMIKHSQEIYNIKKPRYFVKPACVNLTLFDFNNYPANLKTDLPLKNNVCVYPGKFGGIYLEEEVFDFFKIAHDYWQGDFSVLLLTNHSDDEIKKYCSAVNLPYSVILKKFVSHSEVPAYMRLGHFGICPVKPLPSKRYCTPIKTGEYWAMGLPVVITSNISTDSDIIEKNDIGYVLKYLSTEEYTMALAKIDGLIKKNDIRLKIRQVAVKERNFKSAKEIYKTIYA